MEDKEKQIEEKLMELRLDKQELMNEISEKNNKIALLEETIECIKFNVDFTRKETANKFYDKVMSFIGSNQKFWIVDDEPITVIVVDKLFDFMIKTKKQF